jgi:membrane fusion protein (multidrug efflux system)
MRLLKKITVLNFIILAATGCKNPNEKNVSVADAEVSVNGTEVISIHPIKEVLLPGELYPWDKVNIYSRVQGFVKEINVDRGSEVKKGQLLAILDAPEIISELDQAYGKLVAAEALLNEAKTKFSASKLAYLRLLNVNKTEGAVSIHELDQANAKMMSDSSFVTSAEGNLKAANSHYKTRTEMANYLRIEAPFDGTIIERNISPGALIGAGDMNAKPLFVIEDNSRLRLTIAIPEIYSNAIHKTDTIHFKVNSSPHKEFQATFGRSAESVTAKNRVMMIEFDVDNTTGELKAGMYAEANLLVKRLSPTLFVPKTAVVNSGEAVFIIRSVHKKAEWVPVKKGMTLDTLIEVFGTIEPGELIVTEASEEIRSGDALELKKSN